MPSRRVQLAIISAIVLGGTGGIVYSFAARLKPFETPGWGQPGALLMRQADQGSLLLRHLTTIEAIDFRYGHPVEDPARDAPPVIYRFISTARKLDEFSLEAWDDPNDVVDCAQQFGRMDRWLVHDMSARVLRFKGNLVRTRGKTVLFAALSPDGKYVAVLSTTGKPIEGPIPFFSGEIVLGPRYHEVFKCADGARAQRTQVLADALQAGLPCWSPDGQQVIYTDPDFHRLWIVPFLAPDAETSSDKRKR